MLKKVLFITSVLVIQNTFLQSVCAKPHKEYVLAPVFFVTDRILLKTSTGKLEFQDRGQALFNVTGGLKYVPVEKRPDIEQTWEVLSGLGWKDLPQVAEDNDSKALQKAEVAAEKLSEIPIDDSQVISKLKALPQFSSGNSETLTSKLLVFTHGFFNDFDDATKTAADLASNFKRPIVAYCWTTPKHELQTRRIHVPNTKFFIPFKLPSIIESYRESEVTFQQSQERYNMFLKALDYSIGPSNMIVIGHSMGTRLVDQALLCRHGFNEKIRDDEKYSEVMLSNPDLDGRYFTSHCQELADETRKLRVFFVEDDEAMQASKFLHGEQYRLGAPNKGIFSELRQYPVQMVNMSDLDKQTIGTMGHTMPSWVLSNIYKYGTVDGTKQKFLEQLPYGNDSMVVIKRVLKRAKP